jgi:glycerol-3-phosphate acyltransferase PlsY
MVSWVLLIVTAYLLGSLPFGYLIGRAKGIDIRQHGSKNVGATNVGRALGRHWGVTCFVLDSLKGAVPVLAAGWYHDLLGASTGSIGAGRMWLWLAVAAAAVIGHLYPLFLGFKGGKGVATAFGAAVAMYPVFSGPALAALAVWGIILLTTRYMSLASIVAAVSFPLWSLLLLPPWTREAWRWESLLATWRAGAPALIVAASLAAAVVIRHRSNIARLLAGNEMKVGARPPVRTAA